MWRRRLAMVFGVLALIVWIQRSGPPLVSAKTPAWTIGEHPRLLGTSAEQAAVQTKLNAAGTTSNALWQLVLSANRSTSTGVGVLNYADAGMLYWVTGSATYGQRAHDAVMNYVNSSNNVITPTLANYDLNFWQYRDMLLNYDFAYDRFSPAERQTVLTRILLQGDKCHNAGAAWGVGNIHSLWGLCEYASAVMLEGENFSTTVTDEPVTRLPSGTDKLKYPLNAYSVVVRSAAGGGTTYTAGVDYNTCVSAVEGARCIDWSPAGLEPAAGVLYYVSYTVNPQLEQWRIGARMFIENHLNYHWRDGTYTGGLHPYSGAALESIIDFLEIARRDMGVDYTQDVDLKKYVDMVLYERLPSAAGSYIGYRFDTFSDAGTWGEDPINHPSSVGGYRGWARRMVAYGLSRYGNDPEYGPKYLWAWGQYYRNTNGTIKTYNGDSDWREALYFNDSVVSSYPITTLPTPNWPTYRFFRGRDLVIARTDHFGTPNANAAYVSLLAQNHNHQSEHDQGDSGSFTFYSNNEDWAIDPGYQQGNGSGGNSYDHNTIGIDGNGYYANGVYGQQYTTPAYGGFSHVERVALTEGASAIKADLTRTWSLTEIPFVDHQYRYLAMVNGGPASYLVIGDDIQKDNSNHTYQWFFSTGEGNTVVRNGSVATVTGARNNAVLDIHTITPTSTTATIEDWQAGNISSTPYKRLTIQSSSTVNPRFLHLLIPTPIGSSKPVVAQSTVTNGVRATVTWSNGMVDTIFWRTSVGTITDGVTSTDAVLTILRRTSGALTGVMVMDGRGVTQSGVTLFQALDGTQPVTFSSFDGVASVSSIDVARLQVELPALTSAHIADGTTTVHVAHDGDTSYLTTGIPFDATMQNNGQLLSETFTSSYLHNLVVTNFERFPVIDQAPQSGVLDLRASSWDWVSLSRRDSTAWRRSNVTPSAIPADMFGDADYSFKFRFTDAVSVGRKLRFYFRVYDHEAQDWLTNQDYLRLEFDPVAGQVTIGQRLNGAWSDIASNDVLTATTASPTASFNDTNWHTASLRLQGSTIRFVFDSTTLYNGVANGAMPGPGYLQWRVMGAAHVQIDDLVVTTIDASVPVAPDAGAIQPSGASGTATLTYNHGQSPDITQVTLYSSATPIAPTDDPATLAVVGQSANPTAVPIATLNRSVHYAAAVTDAAGNRSQLVGVTLDAIPPDAVIDLNVQ